MCKLQEGLYVETENAVGNCQIFPLKFLWIYSRYEELGTVYQGQNCCGLVEMSFPLIKHIFK
jgi:hypothetical protein